MYSLFCISFCFIIFYLETWIIFFILSQFLLPLLCHSFHFHFNYIRLSFSLDCIIFHKKIAQYQNKTKCMFCQSSGSCFMFKLNYLCYENQSKHLQWKNDFHFRSFFIIQICNVQNIMNEKVAQCIWKVNLAYNKQEIID